MSFVKWAEMRAREEGLVVPESIIRISQNSQSPSKVKHRVDRSHQFKTTQREPMLDDLASQVELYQFRRAQQRLVSTYVSIYKIYSFHFVLFVYFQLNKSFQVFHQFCLIFDGFFHKLFPKLQVLCVGHSCPLFCNAEPEKQFRLLLDFKI